MAIVECPSCKQEVDLGNIQLWVRESETYECQYCHQEFDWTDKDEFRRINRYKRGDAFLHSLENWNVEKNFEFPLLVGNFKARWKPPSFNEILVLPFVLPFLILGVPIRALFHEFERIKYKREFTENVLNPRYLRGTGLLVFPDLSAELIVKRGIPEYVFEKEDLTKIVLHEETYHSSATDYELYLYLHGFHALTIYGFNEGDSKNIVSKLMSIYEIDFQYTSHYNKPDSGGGGGGGG